MSLEGPFEILGVAPDVGPRELKRAYLRAVRKFRPERDPDGFARIRQAYEAAQMMVGAAHATGSSADPASLGASFLLAASPPPQVWAGPTLNPEAGDGPAEREANAGPTAEDKVEVHPPAKEAPEPQPGPHEGLTFVEARPGPVVVGPRGLEPHEELAQRLAHLHSQRAFSEATILLLKPTSLAQIDLQPRLAAFVLRTAAGAAWNAPAEFVRLKEAYPLLFRAAELRYLGGALLHLPRSRLGFEAWRGNVKGCPALVEFLSYGLVVDEDEFLRLVAAAVAEVRLDPVAALQCVDGGQLHDGDLIGLWWYMLQVRAPEVIAEAERETPERVQEARRVLDRASWPIRWANFLSVLTWLGTTLAWIFVVRALSEDGSDRFIYGAYSFFFASVLTHALRKQLADTEWFEARAVRGLVRAGLSSALAAPAFEDCRYTPPGFLADHVGSHHAIRIIATLGTFDPEVE